MQKPSDSQRLFIGLWPNSEVLTKLTHIQNKMYLSCQGRPVDAGKIHLTLLFLGNVETQDVPNICTVLKEIVFTEFCIQLDRVGCWPKSRVGWVGCSSECSSLNQVVRQLQLKMKTYGQDRKPFVPHVTLLRNVRKKFSSDIDPIHWVINEARLVHSTLNHKGSMYETVTRISAKHRQVDE